MGPENAAYFGIAGQAPCAQRIIAGGVKLVQRPHHGRSFAQIDNESTKGTERCCGCMKDADAGGRTRSKGRLFHRKLHVLSMVVSSHFQT